MTSAHSPIQIDVEDMTGVVIARHIHRKLLSFTGNARNCLNVRYPDQLLMLEIFENTTQRCSTIGRANHIGMDADRYDRSLSVHSNLPGALAGRSAALLPLVWSPRERIRIFTTQ
jgi:hypothetical protein